MIGLIVGLAFFVGRRAACHTICWMAPFMIIGRWIRNRFGWPSLQLKVKTQDCTNCMTCSRYCPMSLDVNGMVQTGKMENTECILCGSCVDHCAPKSNPVFIQHEKINDAFQAMEERMRITILNGNNGSSLFDSYLGSLCEKLTGIGSYRDPPGPGRPPLAVLYRLLGLPG